jgi:ATP-binding cassette subfamily F protein uup
VLIVSHDRDFLDQTVTITLGLDGSGRVDIVAGGYEDWERKRQQPVTARPATAAAKPTQSRERAVSKLSYKDQRDLDLLPQRIEEIEASIARDEATLADPDLYRREPDRFAALTGAIAEARKQREAAEERWLELAEKAEALRA